MLANVLFWGLTLGIIGKVLLGVTVIAVHLKIVKEHKIDGVVLKEMRRERNLAIVGIIFMIVGYILEVLYYQSYGFF
ncbi:hypothetical protein A3D62_03365 [Candidatus Kaiserbacteria bacterium RIFCSPHIGHO2_02_FULL_49_11]|uniref:Uncharacterized protein n=1 Tax=Candidatus Kaiserbacteria bacterium RIFCSPHIGHO2_02_FULL_49_11 TaxID=1798489 RepID=A0A1F6D2X6_9BACT|nr:MAG: hypothetical protein A3D62_03365 [Candidatus Kaiserbacteria bacterium RIFCSPHIGHO2_02_FULL_49_11]